MWLFASWMGCAPDLTPTWAWDPIWLEPTEDGGAHGFETWQIHGPKWQRNGKDRYYVCGVVVELEGAPTDCEIEGCVAAFEVLPSPVQTDCPGDLAELPLFLSLQRLAIGGPAAGEVAWPGLTSETFADYGSGWETYGTSWTEALDHGGPGQLGWNGADPYQLVPDAAFPL